MIAQRETFIADMLGVSEDVHAVYRKLKAAGLDVEAARLFDVGRELGSVINKLAKREQAQEATL